VEKLRLCEILFVEDCETDAVLTIRELRKRRVVNDLIHVTDGQQALDFIFCTGPYADREPGNPRLILLDLHLPKVSGLEVLRAIRSDHRTRGITVAVLTDSTQESDITETRRLGVDAYLVKPVGFPEFVEIVTQAGFGWGLVDTRWPDNSGSKTRNAV
jgi:two-component system response regulator